MVAPTLTRAEVEGENDFAFHPTDPFERLATLIADRGARMADALYDIGRALIQAKRALTHGVFLKFLKDARVCIEPRAAQLMMKIAHADDGRQLAAFGIAKASLLLRLIPEARARIIASHDIDRLSVSQLRRLVAEALGHRHKSNKAAHGKGTPEAEYMRGYADGLGKEAKLAWAAGVLHLEVQHSSKLAIQAAFQQMVHIFHPDKGRAAEARFIRNVYDARSVLLAHATR
jgi:hypothetical protein